MPPTTSADRGRDTRQRLLEAAVPLIGEVGWHNVTTRAVAERAQLNPGLVHYHFSSVSELLVTASTSFTRAMLAEAAAELARHPDADAGIDWMLGELSRYTGDDPTSLLLLESFLASTRIPALREQLAASMLEFRAAVAAWLRECGRASVADEAAAILAALFDGIALHRMLDPGLDPATLAAPLRALVGPRTETQARS